MLAVVFRFQHRKYIYVFLVSCVSVGSQEPRTHCLSGPCRVLQPTMHFPIRDCAASSNNRGPRWLQLSAIDVTVKTFFERLYLVLGLAPIGALSQLSVYSYTHTAHSPSISRFLYNYFPRMAPHFFGTICLHDCTPINLADSRYPLCR